MKRREFLKLSAAATAGVAAFAVPGFTVRGDKSQLARAARLYVPAAAGLSDPADQPKFAVAAPNALEPSFIYAPTNGASSYTVGVGPTEQDTGLKDSNGNSTTTSLWGYGQDGAYTWPGRTFEVQSGKPIQVRWENNLGTEQHLLPVDTSLHWAYSLPGYEQYTIASAGVPIVTHLHGGHNNSLFDGNPELFFSPDYGVTGPRFKSKQYVYNNDQPAGNLWYHDHALGLTRLNVYAGLAGFYFVRDDQDTGKADNPLGLPAFPYELAYAIQDRMFTENGELFYPAFPGDPFYDEFITMPLPDPPFENGGPTALAEFFGDHMVVNGMIWPKTDVEPRNYRMHLLNGCDSRFLVVRFRAVPMGETGFDNAGPPIPFWVIGSDQGLASSATPTDTLVFEPGGRYDVVFDFKNLQGQRIILENIGGDAPFGGDFGDALPPGDFFPDRQTDRIMAFDVMDMNNQDGEFASDVIGQYGGNTKDVDNVRKVALFEGTDEFGRLQPLLGTFGDGTDQAGNVVSEWRAIAWHSPTTENPKHNDTEIWEIYNFTGDAHPIHLHLVNFEILDRVGITFDDSGSPQAVLQHNGLYGEAPSIKDVQTGGVEEPAGYVENAPKDMVTALPGQMTRIKATFDKPGRYVWHCHILSHEDHEMMRVLHVGGGAKEPQQNAPGQNAPGNLKSQ